MSYEPYIDGHSPSYYEDEDATGPNLFGALAIFSWRNAIVVLAFWAAVFCFVVWVIIKFTPVHFNDAPDLPLLKLKVESTASAFSGLDKMQAIQISNDNAEILESQRQVLVNTLKARPQLFDLVFSPGLGDYYDANAMLYRPLSEVKGRVAYALSLQPLFNAVAQQPSAATMATLVNEIAASIEQGRDPQGLEDLLALSAKSIELLLKDVDKPVDWSKIGTLDVKGLNSNALILAIPQPGQEYAAQELTTKLLNIISQSSNTSVDAQFSSNSGTELLPPGESLSPQTYFWPILIASLLLGLGILVGKLRMVVAILLPTLLTTAIAVAIWYYIFASEALTLWPVLALIMLVTLLQATAYIFAINIETEKDFAIFTKFEKDVATGNSIARAAQFHGADLMLIAALAFLTLTPLLLMQTGYSFKLVALVLGILLLGVLICISTVSAYLRLIPNGIHWRAGNWFLPIYKKLGDSRFVRNFGMVIGFAALLVAGRMIFIEQQSVFQSVRKSGVTNILVSDYKQAQAAVNYLRAIPEAKAVRWLGMFLPDAANEKREILLQLANQFPRITPVQPGIPQDLREDIDTLQESLKNIAKMDGTKPALKAAADNMRRSLVLLAATSENVQVSQMENRLFGGFNRLADSADNLAQVTVPSIAELPQELQRLFGTDPGPFRLEVEPADGISDAKLQTVLSKLGLVTISNGDLLLQQRALNWVLVCTCALLLLALALTILTIRQTFWAAIALALYVTASLALVASIGITMHFATFLSLLAGIGYLVATICTIQLSNFSTFAFHNIIVWPLLIFVIAVVSYFYQADALYNFIMPFAVFLSAAVASSVLLGPAQVEDPI